MSSTLAKIALVCLILQASIAVNAGQISMGKYFCYVSHMAGIQANNEGIKSGSFKPDKEQFFINIHPSWQPANMCNQPSSEFSNWFLCQAKYEMQIDNADRLRGDIPSQFISPLPLVKTFILSEDGSFISSQIMFLGNYVSDGKCTKI